MARRRKLWFALVVALLVALVLLWQSQKPPAPPRDAAPRRFSAPIDAGLDAPVDDGPISDADAPDEDAARDGAISDADARDEDAARDGAISDADARDEDAALDGAITDGESPDGASSDGASAGEGFEITLAGMTPGDRCTLRTAAQGVVATCDRRAMRCTVLARGALSPDPGEELVSRCEHADGPVFLALSSADTVLWASRTDQSSELPGGTCADLSDLTAEAVTVAGQAQRALLVRVRGCSEPANYVDWDELYWWRDGDFTSVASALFACSYEGATDGPEMNERGTYDCNGGYLTRGPRAADTTFTVVGCETCRQRDLGAGRLMLRRGRVLQTLQWDAESQRFASP